jgi:TonB-dependent starch-binding outer membrane protein SusC
MKEIKTLQLTFPDKVLHKKTLRILKMTIILCMVIALNLFGSVTYGSNSTELKGITKNKTSEILATDVTSVDLQQIKTTGTITDENGNPFVGVNVQIEGTTVGTISDINGKYSISVPNNNSVLIFTFVGYSVKKVTSGGNATIDVKMTPDITNLDEVVVVGYGTARKATITGSVATVTGEKLAIAKSANFTNSLVGRLPGLVAVQRSGLPGADDATIRIRGNNTLNNNTPLTVVDGIAGRSMSRLDAADIESVIVLKDASAAIYGAQAANGVILITTKRGKTGKLKVNADFTQGFAAPTILPDMANSYLYATMMNEVDMYAGQNPRFSADDLQKYKDGTDPYGHPNTDWFKEVFKPFSMQNNANINMTGGTESLKYFVSLGTRYQDGTYRKSGSDYSQVDFRSNVDGKLYENITFSIDVAGRQENRKNTVYDEYSTFRQVPRGKPTDMAWWFGKYPGPDVESDQNPVAMVTNLGGVDRDVRYILESNLKLNVNIPWVKGLSITGNASIDKNTMNGKLWKIPFYLYVWDKLTFDANGLPAITGSKRGVSQPQLTQRNSLGGRTTLNALVNYERRFAEKHKIKFLAGSETSTGVSSSFQASRKYFVSNTIDELFAGGDLEKDNTGSSSESARMNYFGRVNYDFMSKYLLEFVWRYDGSYIFPADKRWGFFPGVSAGYVVSEENFWKNSVPFVNYFKLRGSWGQTGNDRISDFQYLSTYKFASGMGQLESGLNMGEWITNQTTINKVLYAQSIPNINVTWEVANQTDIGFDAQFLGGKLKLEADYFHNLRSNILTQRNASVPQSTGLTLPPENIGKVVNQGFEYVISYGDKIGDLGYNISWNGGYAKNIIKFWD